MESVEYRREKHGYLYLCSESSVELRSGVIGGY